ncbi:MAG TPA: response regulator [Gemmatimonadaceae bacterium]|nr:response regulator [Gemmatimonadaceae bacterium]
MRVVLADDDLVLQRLLRTALERRGHEVTVASDGDTAWRAIEREPPPLAVLDWNMPVVDGLEVCRRARAGEATRDTFLLVVTGRDAPEDVEAALEAGADDYLMKPLDPAGLMARLAIAERRIVLDGERRDAVTKLARAQWLAGIGETAIAVQHEVNNPLTALMIEAQAIAHLGGANAELRALGESIHAQSERIATIVRRLGQLHDPRSVEYLRGGSRMIDLSSDGS